MKKLFWFSHRDEKPAIEIVLSVEAALWFLDHLPSGDGHTQELRRTLVELAKAGAQRAS